jgi:hypothetical protein
MYDSGQGRGGDEGQHQPNLAYLRSPVPHAYPNHYDLTISQPHPDLPPSSFCRWLAEAAERSDLSCALLQASVAPEVIRRLEARQLTIGLHLDCKTSGQRVDDPLARLAFAIHDTGGHAINLAARSRSFTDQTVAPAELLRQQFGVPPTVAIPSPTGIRPPFLTGDADIRRLACWRIFHCLGEMTAFWWPASPDGSLNRREVSAGEMERLGLQPLLQYTQSLAEQSGLEWFSTILCLGPLPAPSRFHVRMPDGGCWPLVALSSLEDPCDVDMQSRWMGALPEEYAQGMAWRFSELAWMLCHRPTPGTASCAT